jgi:SAM-dependent methyltransferase
MPGQMDDAMSADGNAGRRKESFDTVADAYDLYRRSPPPEVVNAVIELANLEPGSALLEIGCGTGQLSVPLAKHGVNLTAIELGPHLAALARQNLEEFPTARVDSSAFEDWPLPEPGFDGVVCANAFHWLDPEIRVSKSAEALRPGGSLEILHMHHVRGGTPGFFEATQPFYLKWGLSDDPFFEPTAPADVPTMYPELDQAQEWSSVARRRFEIPMRHSTASYVGWLRTDSLVNSLDAQARRGFLDDIERLIASNYHGTVERNFVYDLIVATRAS